MDTELKNKNIAILAEDHYEDLELWYPAADERSRNKCSRGGHARPSDLREQARLPGR
jgi:hypothetical protein